VIGCTAPFGEQSRNIARNAWLQAGYPPEVPAMVLDRRCGSAQTAVELAAALVASGTHDLVIAGGVEHMGHVPIDSPARISELVRRPVAGRAARSLRLRAAGRERRADRRPLAHRPGRRWTSSRCAPTSWPPRRSARPVRARDDPARPRRPDAGQRPVHPPGDFGRDAGEAEARCSGRTAGSPRAARRRSPTARPGCSSLRRPPSGTVCGACPRPGPDHRRRRSDHHADRAHSGHKESCSSATA
jgi:hypothetical protein